MAKAREKRRNRPDWWDTASRILGLAARLAGLAEMIRRLF